MSWTAAATKVCALLALAAALSFADLPVHTTKQDFFLAGSQPGGYEQFRFDFENKNPDLFPSRYFYSFGRNYFVSLAFRI